MEKKIKKSNEKLKSQDKPGFHRAKGNQLGLTEKEKKQSHDKDASAKKPSRS